MDFSIITTVLNESKNVQHLLISIKDQVLQPKEFIIVDGGSTDGTIEIIKEFQKNYHPLKLIVDPSCSLKYSAGPIAKGRNVAIRNTTTEMILCCDAGCYYEKNWTEIMAEKLCDYDFCYGGSAVRLQDATFWDILFSVFIGFSIESRGFRNFATGTARAISFRKKVWENIGGFPEGTLLGEDTLFFIKLNEKYIGAFIEKGSAKYQPRFSFSGALKRFYRYVQTDGLLRISWKRALRMIIRAAATSYALFLIAGGCFSNPIIYLVAAAEVFFAFRLDLKGILSNKLYIYVIPRLLLSLCIPFIYTASYFKGMIIGKNSANDQNRDK